MHICYDWAQNVPVPYSPQQISTTYFKSALQAHIFGICISEQNSAQHLNYIIAENEFPKEQIKEQIQQLVFEKWAYYDFSKFLKPYFKELPRILKYNHLLFTSKDPGKVLCQTKAYGTYSTFNILKNRFNINEILDKIPLKSLSKKCQ
ncbi:26469_t:CDS:2, partial [Gigaspora margarita]